MLFRSALHQARTGDPETLARVRQHELAYRMQSSVPELTDLSSEPAETFDLYGPDSRRPGSYAANCVLARRLAERGVRFIQLFHPDWDHHSRLPSWCVARCRDTDQATAGLLIDLKRRGLLDDTLVVWGGEFGRGVAGQGDWKSVEAGRDQGLADGTPVADPAAGVEAVQRRLADLGFDPTPVPTDEGVTLAFGHCPFRDLAETDPALVCGLHQGLVEGLVEGTGTGARCRFRTLVDRDPCQVDVLVGALSSAAEPS